MERDIFQILLKIHDNVRENVWQHINLLLSESTFQCRTEFNDWCNVEFIPSISNMFFL